MILDLLFSSGRLVVPILFAAYGGLLSERSGVANIALESGLLFSAFAAAAVTAWSGHLELGVLAGLGASCLNSFLFSVICVYGRGDQIVIGTAFNLLSYGLIPVFNKALFGNTGSTPALSRALTFHKVWPFVLGGFAAMLALEFLFRKTRYGLRASAVGENPHALLTQGLNPLRCRIQAVTAGGLFVGVGGIYLSLCQGSGYVREMSAGRGFIALAALIFGGWRPWPTLLACFFFAFTDAVQIQLQGREIMGWSVPNQFVQILPYVATLIVLTLVTRKISAPRAINQQL